MKVSAKGLIFISRINRDGSGTTPVDNEYADMLRSCKFNNKYELRCLSITKGTYIASGFNSFVVKLKLNTMTREEFIETWGYQTAEGYGGTLFDCRKKLKEHLDELLKQEAKDVFGYVHRFGSHSDFVIETLYENYQLYKDNQSNK